MYTEARLLAMSSEPILMAKTILDLEEKIKLLEQKLANITQEL